MKKFISLLLSVAVLALLCSCGSQTDDAPFRVTALKGPTGIGMAPLMESVEDGSSSLDCTFTLAATPEEVSASIVRGDFDIAAVPVNLAAVLYNKGADVKFLAVNTLGVLYVLENGDTVRSVADLKGKTVYATGKGATPEYVLEYILTANGLTVGKDVAVEYLAEHAELASKLAADTVSVGMLPEPQVTSALLSAKQSGNTALRVALDLTEEWEKIGDSQLVQGVLVVRGEFFREHASVVSRFIDEYSSSVDFVNGDIENAAALCEKFGIVPKAAVAKNAVPNCNIVCMPYASDEMGAMLKVLFDANPASVGGKLPDDGFYIAGK